MGRIATTFSLGAGCACWWWGDKQHRCWESIFSAILGYTPLGKPVIATNVGGTPELVVDGETGLLVRPGDSHGLAHAIQYMLEHPEQAVQMGLKGRARIESEFRMETIAARYIDLWQDVAAG